MCSREDVKPAPSGTVLAVAAVLLLVLPAASAGPIEDTRDEAEDYVEEVEAFAAWFINRTIEYIEDTDPDDNATEIYEKMQTYFTDVSQEIPGGPIDGCLLRDFQEGNLLPTLPNPFQGKITGRYTGAQVRGEELVLGTYAYHFDLGGSDFCGPGSLYPKTIQGPRNLPPVPGSEYLDI